ncbi:MAG: uroporphyrinogen decarboxylase [Chloroflexi bacterium]|nr:uroporphyrinogen decarboxylase [Chloroflexota bacterium]
MRDRFLRAGRRAPVDRTPIWLMRQAGRYLPEYRALREKYDMLAMCRAPELAVEVTLQPLRRFDLDAAILFSDIMIPLRGMGVDFEIKHSVGPIVANPVRDRRDAENLRVVEPERDVPFVMQAIRLLRRELDGKVPLIGFAGAPFTLASYIVEGKPSRDLLRTKSLMYGDSAAWHTLMDKLAASVSAYLLAQIRAGAQAVQLFDSWVGALSPRDYRAYVLPYSKKIFDALSATGVPRIHFGTGTATLLELMQEAGGEVIGLDWRVPLDQAWDRLGDIALQGNLDPAVMLAAPEIVEQQTRAILSQADGRRGHIFNLGHGILPNTPIENVERLVEIVHSFVVETLR